MKAIRLQYYLTPPVNITENLENVTTLSIQRLEVLQMMERINQDYFKTNREYTEKITNELFKLNELSRSSFWITSDKDINNSIKTEIKNDRVSHFFLAMACCKTEEMKNWFIKQELALFKHRFQVESTLNPKIVSRFLHENKIVFEECDEKMREKLARILDLTENEIIYKFDSNEINMSEMYYAEKGYLFVSQRYIMNILQIKLRSILSENLAICRMHINELNEQSGIFDPLFEHIKLLFLGQDQQKWSENTAKKAIIKSEDVKNISKKSFPPCMKLILNKINKDHHVKHWGRMQFGLFLKGIGMPMEESLKFWSRGFQPKYDATTFEKNYAYNVRHSYGKEGKRTSYSPYSCLKIITGNKPGADDCHGCAFAHSNVNIVVEQLDKIAKVTNNIKEAIIRTSNEGHYQISCAHYFRAIHGLPEEYPIVISHPNQYFDESRKIIESKSNNKFDNHN